MAGDASRLPGRTALLFGSGSAEVTAYGAADAEATLEKLAASLAPASELRVLEIRRLDGAPKIVERFRLEYRLRLPIELSGGRPGEDRREAYAAGREAVAGSVFERVVWEKVEIRHGPSRAV